MALTNPQLHAYYTRIALPPSHILHTTTPPLPTHLLTLPLLHDLQKHHLASIPFENLALHYIPASVPASDRISITPQAVFEKLVEKRRGGYCMENSGLFGMVIRSLGFEVVSTGARVSLGMQPPGYRGRGKEGEGKGEGWTGFGHMIHLVTVYPSTRGTESNDARERNKAKGKRYFVDTGFGSLGPTQPLCIDDDLLGTVYEQLPGTECRVVGRNLGGKGRGEGAQGRSEEVYVYETRLAPARLGVSGGGAEGEQEGGKEEGGGGNGDEDGWKPVYCFSDQEFLQADFEVMNHFTSTHPSSWFTKLVVCVRFLFEGNEGGEWRERASTAGKETVNEEGGGGARVEDRKLVGSVQLSGDTVKKRVNGETEVLKVCERETERTQALERWFGVVLAGEEKKGIEGTGSELR